MTMTVTTTTQPRVAPARPRIRIPSALRYMLRRLTGRTAITSTDGWQSALTGMPDEFPSGQAKAADRYTRGQAVWAYIARRWLPAHVAEIDASSVLVTYHVPGTAETSLEVVHRSHLALRGRNSDNGRALRGDARGNRPGQARHP